MREKTIAATAALLLGLAPAAAQEASSLTGKWRVERIAGAGEFDAGKSMLEFLPDGTIASTIGCNRIAGKPAIKGGAIAFGPMAMTRMACPPPLDDIETKYAAALDAARSFRLDRSKLSFIDDKGQIVARLRRID